MTVMDPFTPEQIAQWRKQLDHRDVAPDLEWEDQDVMRLVARFLDTLDTGASEFGQHEPGEAHRYGPLVCEVCGVRGQVHVSIVPERAS